MMFPTLIALAVVSQPWFTEEAVPRGLQFDHDSGHTERYLFPECVCGGVALLDVDNDGDLDAYLVQSGPVPTGDAREAAPNMLFLNDGSGFFKDHTGESGDAADRGYGMGVTCGDYDNDGDMDIYVTNFGRNTLLRNDGGGSFTDVTLDAGVGDEGWGASCAFFDYDADGDLDLFVVNYVNWSLQTEITCYATNGEPDYCSPKNYHAPAMDTLYRNEGDGTFTDVTRKAGLDVGFGNGLGIVCGDFNDDGLIDAFIANDGMPDQLWENQGDGTFRDIGLEAGVAIDNHGLAKAGMGTDAIDIDDDDDLDLLVVNLANETDSFYRNEGGFFLDDTALIGLGTTSRPMTRFGVAFIDFDHDGLLDLFQANGRVMKQSRLYTEDPYAEPNVLMRGTESGRFQEVLPKGGTSEELLHAGRGAAFGDVDNDGDVDILIVNKDGPAHLLINTAEKQGKALTVRVVDTNGRDAFGAIVRLTVGDRTLRREVRAAYSYCSSNDPRAHVGLGNHDEATDVSVQWPDGTIESFGTLGAGEIHVLRRGEGNE